MGKRKRQRGSRLGGRNRGEHASALVAIGNKIRSSSKSLSEVRRWQLVVAVVGVLLLSGILIWEIFFPARSSSDILLGVDLTGVETQVAEKIRRLRKEVERNPGSAAAWGKFAMNLDVHDLKREALPCYQQAAELDPTDFRWQYYCATMLGEMGSPEALQWFERSQALNASYVPVHVLYGEALLHDDRLEEASHAFHLALSANSKSSHAHLGLAQVELSQGDLNVSRQHLLQAVEIDPKHGEVHGLLAEIYRRLNEPEKADRESRMAQQLPKVTPVPDSVYAELAAEGISAFWYETRGRAYLKKRRYREAARQFTMALKVRPSAEAHHNVAFALQYLRKYEEAVEHYRAALALRPAYRDALNNLATALFELGYVEESIAYLEEAKRLDPAFPDAYLNLGTFLMRSGRAVEAIDAFQQGLTNAPYDPRTAMKLAWLLATSMEPTLLDGTEAVRLAKMVCEITDYRIPETLDVLAAAYAQARQFRTATNTARQAYQLAMSASRPALATKIDSHLKFYEAKQPYRE